MNFMAAKESFFYMISRTTIFLRIWMNRYKLKHYTNLLECLVKYLMNIIKLVFGKYSDTRLIKMKFCNHVQEKCVGKDHNVAQKSISFG